MKLAKIISTCLENECSIIEQHQNAKQAHEDNRADCLDEDKNLPARTGQRREMDGWILENTCKIEGMQFVYN